MNIWAKMITALRGGATEVGEAIVDSQALRILDQELRDASDELRQSKESLANIMAHQKLAEEKCKKLQGEITTHERYATDALDKNEQELALQVAEKIASMENQMALEQEHSTNFAKSASELKFAIQQAEQHIKRLKQQVDTVKATENVQRAQAAVAEKYSGSTSKLNTAMESLERIKEKQDLRAAKLKANQELAAESSDRPLAEKLEKAGIKSARHGAEDVLARLKKKE